MGVLNYFMYQIIQKRKIWYLISVILSLVSILSLVFWGFKSGIDFTGGAIVELKFNEARPDNSVIEKSLAELNLPTLTLQPVGEADLLIRTVSLTEEQHQQLLEKIEQIKNPGFQGEGIQVKPEALGIEGEGVENLQIIASGEGVENLPENLKSQNKKYISFEELRFDSIGPVIGQELKRKTVSAIIIVLLAIIAYIAYSFRKASHPVESWKYGVTAVIALSHDVLILAGVFSVLGHFWGIQIDAYFVTALLTTLGYSVHDTIVTFDRTRENLHRHQDKTFEEVINISINQTITRSLNTTLTTLFALTAIFLFGGVTVKYFVLALMIGFTIGTYSSIFLASPLLLLWYRFKKY